MRNDAMNNINKPTIGGKCLSNVFENWNEKLNAIPKTDPSVRYLHNRGVQHLVSSSYVCIDGPYRGRILLPAMWLNELMGFEAKSYAGKKPKSLFPDWFLTSATVYTTRRWDNNLPFCVVTESIIDAETLGVNAIGLYGSTLSWAQWNCLIHSILHMQDL